VLQPLAPRRWPQWWRIRTRGRSGGRWWRIRTRGPRRRSAWPRPPPTVRLPPRAAPSSPPAPSATWSSASAPQRRPCPSLPAAPPPLHPRLGGLLPCARHQPSPLRLGCKRRLSPSLPTASAPLLLDSKRRPCPSLPAASPPLQPLLGDLFLACARNLARHLPFPPPLLPS
jgi:hypothetical protein